MSKNRKPKPKPNSFIKPPLMFAPVRPKADDSSALLRGTRAPLALRRRDRDVELIPGDAASTVSLPFDLSREGRNRDGDTVLYSPRVGPGWAFNRAALASIKKASKV